MLSRFSVWALVAGLALVALMLLTGWPFSASRVPDDGVPLTVESLGVVREKKLREISGIARSHVLPGAWWVHNDSGDDPQLFLLSEKAQLLGTWSLDKASARDWEDIASFQTDSGKSYLLVGDIGDNGANRQDCGLILLAEPQAVGDAAQPQRESVAESDWRRLNFRYEDGPRNCEALAVDVAGRCAWLIEKLEKSTDPKRQTGIYQLDLSSLVPEWSPTDRESAAVSSPTKPEVIAKRVGQIKWRHVTGMDMPADSRSLIVRDYYQARWFRLGDQETWTQCLNRELPPVLQLPLEPQGEAIGFTGDGKAFVTISEFSFQPLWLIKSPEPRDKAPALSKQ